MVCGILGTAQAQAPPDPFGDADNPNYEVIPNVGQVLNDLGEAEPDIAYCASGGTYFQNHGLISFVFNTSDTLEGITTQRRLDASCAGGKANYPDPVASMLREQTVNYYLPQCGPEGASAVPVYGQVMYPEVYPFIDLYAYSSINGQKLAFVVKPGGAPKDIELLFQGQDNMEVDDAGNLVLMIEGQPVMLPAVYTYQTDSTDAILPLDWATTYLADIGEGKATFEVGAYDESKSLVLLIGPPAAMTPCCTWSTPGLCWSTFYGAEDFDYPKDIKSDLAGNIYVAGRSESAFLNFPQQSGASNFAVGNSVATLTKFNPQHVLLWTVFHAGTANANANTYGNAVAVKKNSDQVYLAGSTYANDFFTWTLAGAYNSPPYNNGNLKGFVARYNGNNGALQWAAEIGGDANVTVDAIDVVPFPNNGRIAISGIVSGNLDIGNFLPPSGGYSFSANHGGKDAYVALFTGNDNIFASAFYGGSQDESRALVRYGGKSLMLAGNTVSPDLPVGGPVTSFTEGYHGNMDVFIAQISLTGAFTWATYFGGGGDESLAPQGLSQPKDLYLTGTSDTLPTLVNGPDYFDNVPSAQGINGFIARFAEDTHAPKWISYLGEGASGQYLPYCITAGPNDANYGAPVVVGGYSDGTNFPLVPMTGMYNQPNIVPDLSASKDGFIMLFTEQQHLQWSTYFGGQGGSQNQPEDINAVLYQQPSMGQSFKIYAVGYTSQSAGVVPTPIPLDGNTYSGMFFNPNYNYNGTIANYTDGFIVQFCNDFLPYQQPVHGAAEDPDLNNIKLSWSPSGILAVLGLSDGPHQLQVYDPQGRLVLERQVRSEAGRSDAVQFSNRGAAVYVIVVDHERTQRLVPIH